MEDIFLQKNIKYYRLYENMKENGKSYALYCNNKHIISYAYNIEYSNIQYSSRLAVHDKLSYTYVPEYIMVFSLDFFSKWVTVDQRKISVNVYCSRFTTWRTFWMSFEGEKFIFFYFTIRNLLSSAWSSKRTSIFRS